MTTTQLILLLCAIAVVVVAIIIFAVVRHHKNSSGPSAPSDAAAAPGTRAAPTEPTASAAQKQTQPAAQEQTSTTVERPESNSSRLVRLRSRLSGSGSPFGKALFSILSRDNLSESDWEDVEDTLLLADVGAEASEQIVESLRSDARVTGEKDPTAIRQMLRERLLVAVRTDMDRSLVVTREPDQTGSTQEEPEQNELPSVIIMVGVNGTGKTTTAGKLGRLLVADGKKVILGAADTFRAAAADQLETWGKRVGIEVVRSDHDGADPASVAFDAAERAKAEKADALIIDTAGRLQNKANLMDELGKIRRVVEKTVPVGEVLLVLDATTGQNGMSQARVFAQAIGITGVVLTKLDGSAKGGIVIAVQRELGVPVKLVGLGEEPDDLAVFDPAAFVDGILG
ncbi:MAG: signal recognition particle-docking protein FtsY [Bifidobacteriaceae bacterium]|jgi:fused signal recognition particle receptor|nr:signal recognition particle-docking protein FtsY [Bifidobacteriaceae bacterium]